MSTCVFCHQDTRDCWATRCGEDELEVTREDAEADRGDMLRSEEKESA